MEQSLKNRLTFGPLMLGGLFILLWLDDFLAMKPRGWMEGTYSGVRGRVGGVGLLVLLAFLLALAVQEIAILFPAENVRPYRLVAASGCSLLIVHAFLTQFPPFQPIAA